MTKPTPKPRITGKVLEVPIDSIAPNKWNPNVQSEFKFEQTRKVIREYGFLDPCTVRSGRPGEKAFKKMEIIDGEHRWKAAKAEGLSHVLVEDVGKMTDAKAATLTDIMNNLRGENDPIKWAEMVGAIKDSGEDLLGFLPYQEGELDAMMGTADVDWDAFGSDPSADKTPRDDDGELYKKFSVSVPKATMDRAAKLMRRVKAAHNVDSDAKAFEAILAGYEAYAAAQAGQSGNAGNAGRSGGRRRKSVLRSE